MEERGVFFDASDTKYHRPTGTACHFRVSIPRLHRTHLSFGSMFLVHVTLPRPERLDQMRLRVRRAPPEVTENASAQAGASKLS